MSDVSYTFNELELAYRAQIDGKSNFPVKWRGDGKGFLFLCQPSK